MESNNLSLKSTTSWLSAIQLFSMDQISRDRFPPFSSKFPWLIAQSIVDESDNTQDQFFFCTLNNELPLYRCRIPELLGKRIRGFFHGWVILSNHPFNNIWSLWNQATSKIISLPTLVMEDGEYESIRESCLSAPPDDPSSILLLTTTSKSIFLICPIDSKREDFRWTKMSYAQELKRLTSNGKLLRSLTCCNGKVYSLSIDGNVVDLVIHLDIVVKYNEVVINLMPFSLCPCDVYSCRGEIQCLKGSSTELFYIQIAFDEETENLTENKPTYVYLFKSDMTCINWEEREFFKDWDLTNYKSTVPGRVDREDSSSESSNMILHEPDSEFWTKYYRPLTDMCRKAWEVIDDFKDAIFFVDGASDYSVSYSPVVSSELGGYIHIRGEMGKTIYSYNVKDNTISLSSMPSPMLPTTIVSMWECSRLEDVHKEVKCIVNYKEEIGNSNKISLILGKDNGVEFKNSLLLDIPSDLLEMIMELCLGVEYMNFRATCKRCLVAAPLIKWSNETSVRRLQTYSLVSPWLMVVDRKRGIITFTDPMSGDNYFLKNSKVLIDESDRICYSRFGWLLFKKRDVNRFVFFNPFTDDLRKLPKTEHDLEDLCFSAPPTSPDCMVAGFTETHVCFYFVNQKGTWRRLRLVENDPPSVCFSAFYGGDLFVFCREGKVIVVNNLGKQDCSGELYEDEAIKDHDRSPTPYYIMNCDQHRLLVSVDEYGEAVEVFKRNESKEIWEKIDSVGKHTIYICGTTGLCIEAKAPIMENKIFFPRLLTKNKRFVFYSLDTCRYHTFDTQNFQEHLVDFFGTTHHLNVSVWIEPSWS